MNWKIIIYLIFATILIGCASYEAKYREPLPLSEITIPKEDIEKTFYLIGDAGYAQEGESTPALLALEQYLKQNPQKGNYTIFLGDNIYPDGMPKKDAKDRAIAEHRLDVQIEAVKNFDGQVYFIPGNHDWYNEGLTGLRREEKYFEKKIVDKQAFRPSRGCPLTSIDVSENIQLMILDSQWFLEDWDKHPTINDDCPEIKTREALFLEIESEFKKNQNKTIVFTLHHPLYTNGVHGGKFAPSKHLFPSQKKIPLPILGSLATLIRTTGGVSIQDNLNEQYRKLVRRLETLAKGAERIIFASGHEHSIQYIEHNGIKQIVSGSGAKSSYAVLGDDGHFAYGAQGFVRLDILKDGSSVATYYGTNRNQPELVYQTQVYPPTKSVDLSTLPETTDSYKMASIYREEGTQRTELYEGIWGDHYRELYGTDIKAKVALLDTLYGGLEVIRRGGGHQTRTLRLKDTLGREYNLRALKKSGVLFLQSVLFKDQYVAESLENTVSEDILQDFYTGAYPYAFLVVPDMAEAIGVYHTNPKLFYIPKQKALGDYNIDYGDELYMIEERPEEGHKNLQSFGKPDDIESTSDLYERLRRDEKYKVDEPSYVRARLFDMLLGDWDRHEDQWRWAEFELENGDHLFKPIPRDRDQVFSNFDGAFLGALRGLMGFANQFQVYGPKVDDVKWLNISALRLDRTLLNNTQKDVWLQQAKFIQHHLTDEVIENAFRHLPSEAQGKTTERLKTFLKGRRDNLVSIAQEHHTYLTKLAIVTGTDKDDYITITRLADGKTHIEIARIKDGEKADIVSDKTYDRKTTKEIWVYGLDDDDIFETKGTPDHPIKLRIIGGQNNDVYRIKKGRKIRVYDHNSKPNTIESKGGARFKFTDDYDVNHFNKDQRIFGGNSIFPTVGFNPDDGLLFGLTSTYTYNGFYRNPFTQQHQIRLGYYVATSSFDIQYQGEFAGIFNNYNLMIGGIYTNPNFAVNFFGFGNDTENFQDQLGFDYNRVRLSRYGFSIGLQKDGRFGSFFGYKATLDGIEIDRTANRFISSEFGFPNDAKIFDRQWFAGLDVTYRYETYDVVVNPSKGMKFELNGGFTSNLSETDRTYGYIKPSLGFYNPLSKNNKLVLKTGVLSHFNIGKNYEFFQAAQIGGENLLRGYRNQRFSGQTALAGNLDLRYGFDQFKTKILPLQIGVFAGAGSGRVWIPDVEETNTWHTDFGGGIWINSTDAISGTLNLFTGEDGARFSFSFKLKF